MTVRPPRILMAAYGGGHAAMIAPVAKGLRALGADVDLVGFTTARAAFERADLEAGSVIKMLDPDPAADAPYREAALTLLTVDGHADVTREETEAYFTIGLRDLAEQLGLDEAMRRVRIEGRKAFLPVSAMERYLLRTKPDLVISTTSPRFELALLRAARRQGIPSVALGDLFLVDEREWILSGDYAEHLTVISPVVAEELARDGLVGTQTHVTGNPAFDTMRPRPDDGARRDALRLRLGLSDRTVILWPAAQLGAMASDQRPYARPDEVVAAMERICERDPGFAYLLRPHPNAPFEMPEGARNGVLDLGILTPEEALLTADLVCVEVSTMGLQAALLGKPVVCVTFAHEAGFPRYGLAQVVESLDGAVDLIAGRRFALPSKDFSMPPLGSATSNVIRLLQRLAATIDGLH